ncbi:MULTISPECIES: YiiX family permuted papain-like enzyme [unclassified Acinetobacter]|uniref:YiiX family permuted papain-like enzyme n=1 Tax=unclassified Acinetobacter TaxID=196816 RepID=UPI002578ED3D|nr:MULTISPECIES: YiiX family permuted papain-like enzyme [unclassified Acinetobacter]MDM1756042.1 YiiX family permuted papain-like enzyme [Acinetobacter sp. 256-1]MDM1760516.1 YiiX family permuted papain-like enzyme [Acinetobacter sp. 251-1]
MSRLINTLFYLILMLGCSAVYALPLQTGDVIFQTSKSAQSQVIQLATHSPYSHMGMLVNKNGRLWVLEAIQPVQYTPFEAWIRRGVDQKYVVKRLIQGLNSKQQNALIKNAEQYLNKPYDIYFEWDDRAIYCSEIVWKAYKNALAIELTPLQQLKNFDLTNSKVKALMKQRYGEHIPLQEKVISPKALFDSRYLKTVYSQ